MGRGKRFRPDYGPEKTIPELESANCRKEGKRGIKRSSGVQAGEGLCIINKKSEGIASSSNHLHETPLQDEWSLGMDEKDAQDRNVIEGFRHSSSIEKELSMR